MKPCCESVERYYEDKLQALEARMREAQAKAVVPTQIPQWATSQENRRLFVCACVGDDARDLLRFIADAFKARTIVCDTQLPRGELLEDLLRETVKHNPDAAAEMLVNILTHVGILEHGGNWRGSWTHGGHDQYLRELLGPREEP